MNRTGSLIVASALLVAACATFPGSTAATTTTIPNGGIPLGTLGTTDGDPSEAVVGGPDATIPRTTVPDERTTGPAVETFPDLGADHLSDDAAAAVINGTIAGPEYNSVPPTSGTHTPGWAQCGIYRQVIPDAVQVHTLEHGAVIIQYDPQIDPADIADLEEFARAKGAHIVVAPYEGLPAPIVLTAWTVRLQLTDVVGDAIDAFWLEYANEGPERVPCPLEVDEASAAGA